MSILSKNQRQEMLEKYFQEVISLNLEYLEGENLNSLEKRITAFHYYRAISLLKAIYSLSMTGPAIEIAILLRSLFNVRVILHWILADHSNDRLNRYHDFRHIYRKKFSDYFEQNGIHPYSIEKDEINSKYDEIVDKYDLKKFRDINNWSQKTIWKISEEIGAQNEYRSLYAATSDFEHTNSNIEPFYLRFDEEGTIEEFGNQNQDFIMSFILLTIHYFLVVKHLTAKTFQLDHLTVEKEIEDFREFQKSNFDFTD